MSSVATQITQITSSVGGAIAAPIAGAAIASTGAMTAATATALVGGGIAAVAVAVMAWLNRKGPRQKVATTQMVNEVEPLLKQNVEEYLAGPRTPESQALAKKNFQDVWNWLTSSQACGSSEMGNPGKACISDRNRGGRWDWWSYYYDPIANDTPVQAPTILQTAEHTADTLMAALTGGSTLQLDGDSNDFMLIAGIGLLALVVFA